MESSSELLLALTEVLTNPKESQEIVNAATDLFEKLKADSDTNTAQVAQDVLSSLPQRVFFHFKNQDMKQQHDKTLKELIEKNFVVPPAEVVTGGFPSSSEVRYFKAADKGTAMEVADTLKEKGVEAKVRDLSTSEYADKAASKTIEVWVD